MERINSLKQLLTYLVNFSEAELEIIASSFKPKLFNRNTIILERDEVCKEFYFVYKGCLRTYFLDIDGRERTRYIMLDFNIGTALSSFIYQNPSFEYLDALEDTEVLAISYSDFFRLNKELPNWTFFYQKILEMAYSFQNKRIEDLIMLTAKERYEQLIKERPEFIKRLSNKIISSYLDIAQETLSRLKSK